MVEAAALALSTAPGDGYGRIWKSGPLAVTSAPVRASFFCGNPDDHVPLWGTQTPTLHCHVYGESLLPLQTGLVVAVTSITPEH